MDVLQAVLDYEVPSYWKSRSASAYSDSYLLYEVERDSTEWSNAIVESYYENEVTKLERVQNPFQLGLFKIQEEKRISEGESSAKCLGYHVIHPQDKDIALKFPLDYRRYVHKRPHLQQQTYEKHPKFYDTLGNAFDAGQIELSYEGSIVVILSNRFVNITNQGDYLPKYAITLST